MIYFDHASGQIPDRIALKSLADNWREYSFNQEAAHYAAYFARQGIEEAEERLKSALGIPISCGVVWGNSGSELINLLSLLPIKGKRALAVSDHPALIANFGRSGDLIECEVSSQGLIDTDKLDKSVGIVAFGAVNGETGVIQNWKTLATAVRSKSPTALLVADFVQGACKLDMPSDWDFLLVSGHKFGSPGGAALFYRDAKWKQIFSDLRHREYRIGRVEAATIFTLTEITERRIASRAKDFAKVTKINNFLRRELKMAVEFSLPPEMSSPYILHFAATPYQGAVLVRMLSEAGIMAAAGSACKSQSKEPSRVLKAMKWSDQEAFAAIRLSFSPSNTLAEAAKFVQTFKQILAFY